MEKKTLFLPLFRRFINESVSGKRLKMNGTKIKKSTISSYEAVEKLLAEYDAICTHRLVVYVRKGNSAQAMKAEKKYWANFYRDYSAFLYRKGFADNYVGMQFKIIRVFLRYLALQKGLHISEHYRNFYVVKEEAPVITLNLEQLKLLIRDAVFYESLPLPLQVTRDIFVFGCSVGLRVSDLSTLRLRNISHEGGAAYLIKKSIKTGTHTRIKLPDYCDTILQKYAGKQRTLLPVLSLSQFNKNLKKLGEAAGWTWIVGKERGKQGITKTVKTKAGKEYRFCDLMSSHMMRKTTITSMLLLGMPEPLVRKISGHAANSKEFYRYVKYSQSYLDEHTDAVFEKLGKSN